MLLELEPNLVSVPVLEGLSNRTARLSISFSWDLAVDSSNWNLDACFDRTDTFSFRDTFSVANKLLGDEII